MTDIIMCDLDSTIADTRPRWKLGPREDPKATWTTYAMQCQRDLPIESTIRLLDLLGETHDIHIVSGRDILAYDLTVEWLAKYNVRYDELHLSSGSYHIEHKLAHARQMQELGRKVAMHIDDWASLQPDMAQLGIPTVIVDSMYHIEHPDHPGVVSNTRVDQ